MRKFIWKVQYPKPQSIKDIMKNIIKQKHLDITTIKDYINGDVKTHSYTLLNNLEDAVKELCNNAHHIFIQNDSDPDGITSGCIMYLGLKELSSIYNWKVEYSVAERKDGYGLSKTAVNKAINNGADYIITTDNGITANEAIEYAQENGIKVIVTDHHLPGKELPKCLIIDPQIDDYPFKYICGALVAFKFIEAVFDYSVYNMSVDLYEELLSFVAIGTVSDVMKLTDENRFYVSKGLEIINRTKNLGLQALIREANLTNVTAETIAFHIGPMLNAANRLSSPQLAMDLLLADDEVIANERAKKLANLNRERRKLQKEAADNISPDILQDNFIILYQPNITNGICGSIASSISDKYKKPCFVLSGKNRLVGSGRSAKGYSILDFIKSIPDLVQGGGHAAAAGIAVDEDKLEELRQRANEHFNNWLLENDKDIEENLYILNELSFNLIDMRLANNLEALAPFGNGNPRPMFMTSNVNVISASCVGTDKNVLRLELEKNDKKFIAIAFADVIDQYNTDMTNIDIVYNITLNEWNNSCTVQLQLVDLRKSMNNERWKSI